MLGRTWSAFKCTTRSHVDNKRPASSQNGRSVSLSTVDSVVQVTSVVIDREILSTFIHTKPLPWHVQKFLVKVN